MAVAKTYEKMEICGEPFIENGKKYVKVVGPCKRCGGKGQYSYNPLNGSTCFGCSGSGKQSLVVRWYTDTQRASMDKAAEKRKELAAEKQEARRVKFAARNAFGFGEEGYITIFWGDNDAIKEWRMDLPEHTILYNTIFGWYMPSNKHVNNFPAGIAYRRLDWTEVRAEDDPEDLTMKDNEIVAKYVNNIIYGENKSEFQGTLNEWLVQDVVIEKNIALDSHYGESHMHIMKDSDQNVYVWTTSSKSLEEGKTFKIKMKVKEHKEYKGVKQTIVYYCKVV